MKARLGIKVNSIKKNKATSLEKKQKPKMTGKEKKMIKKIIVPTKLKRFNTLKKQKTRPK